MSSYECKNGKKRENDKKDLCLQPNVKKKEKFVLHFQEKIIDSNLSIKL